MNEKKKLDHIFTEFATAYLAKPELFSDLSSAKPVRVFKMTKFLNENSLLKTLAKRPDLLKDIKLTKKQKKLLEEWTSKAIL